VLRNIRRRSLARLRLEVEPVEPAVLARLVTRWQGVTPGERRAGLDALLDAVEKLQGLPLPASALEREVLPARIEGYLPGDLDALAAAGEIVWVGVSAMGPHDGRIALYLTDNLTRLHQPRGREAITLEPREQKVLRYLEGHGASFFAAIHDGTGGGFPQATVNVLWSLVWKGLCTNDTFRALRAFTRAGGGRGRKGRERLGSGGMVPAFRSRRTAPAAAEGRWSLVTGRLRAAGNDTERAAALAQQLLARYGLVTREVAAAEEIPGGWSGIYEVLRTMEETGKIRRGYFVAQVAAMQFALPPVLEMLRALRERPEAAETVTLLAVDPANPYGALLPWPAGTEGKRGPLRAVGTHVVLVDGALAAWVGRGGRQLLTFLPTDEPDRGRVTRALATALARLAGSGERRDRLMLEEIDDTPAAQHPLAVALTEAGFASTYEGLQYRPSTPGRRPAAFGDGA
jgi:ATP-dependent Lhr-like helicase